MGILEILRLLYNKSKVSFFWQSSFNTSSVSIIYRLDPKVLDTKIGDIHDGDTNLV